jgi:hypothetical protein
MRSAWAMALGITSWQATGLDFNLKRSAVGNVRLS